MRVATVNWSVPKGAWAGKCVSVVGGGPSLSHDMGLMIYTMSDRIIAVNNAGLDLVPSADMLFFADGHRRWFDWHKHRLDLFKGEWLVTRSPLNETAGREIFRVLPARDVSRPSQDPSRVAGRSGGAAALNIALLLGARTILLWGFDMKPGSWHDTHKTPTRPSVYAETFRPELEGWSKIIPDMWPSARILNVCPDSALECWPRLSVQEALLCV